jgi:hypothetical protein
VMLGFRMRSWERNITAGGHIPAHAH